MNKLLILLLIIIVILCQKEEKEEKEKDQRLIAQFDFDKVDITDIIIRRCLRPCPLGHICIGGRCIPIFFGCPWRRCPFGYICLLGRCIRLPIYWQQPCIGPGCGLIPEFPFLKEQLAGKFPDIKDLKTDL